jgi:hypothetical protein
VIYSDEARAVPDRDFGLIAGMCVATPGCVLFRRFAFRTDSMRMFGRTGTLLVIAGFAALACAGCDTGRRAAEAPQASPLYTKDTGKLEQLASDRDGDGKLETRAYMDGAVLKRIEIDRNGDGAPDRWEYYSGGRVPAAGRAVDPPVIERAEESKGPDGRITRREFYAAGAIERVEEDTNDDGHTDKWEWYEGGNLARVELDLIGKGYPSQRLLYGAGGVVVRVETDPDGDGTFVVVPARGAGN